MFLNDIFNCLLVTACLAVLLVVPFLPLSRLLTGRVRWPVIVLGAFVLGCSTQAVTGVLWSHIIRGNPQLEVVCYFSLCLVMTIAGFFLQPPGRTGQSDEDRTGGYGYILAGILFAAFLVRSVHPLQTFALGQSDAYTHLHYLHYIADLGYLANPVYPPGYHWLLVLPVLVFNVDPYVMARFSGAFFGTAMVLAIYVFLEKMFDRRAAVFGSFCAACFPGMVLLMKTGVGSFANQLGLLLVPSILCFYGVLIRDKGKQAAIFFLVATLGAAASVPMMLLHVFIIFSLERVVTLFRERKQWLINSVLIICLCLPAVLFIGFHFSQSGASHRFQTAKILTGYSSHDTAVTEKILKKVVKTGEKLVASPAENVPGLTKSPYFSLVVDYMSVKRVGYGNSVINTMAVVLLLFFFGSVIYGLSVGHTGFLLLGIWGCLTSFQAGTGLLQFSSYQREGWSLLIAVSCLCGVAAGRVYSCYGKYTVLRIAAAAAMVLSLGWTIFHPPAHPAIQSSAENLLIRTVRWLASGGNSGFQCEAEDIPECRLASYLDPSLPVTLVTRKFVGWHNQGEIVPNVLPPHSQVRTMLVSPAGAGTSGSRGISFSRNNQYVVLIDRPGRLNSRLMISAFTMVNPVMVRGVLQQQKYLFRANATILEYIDTLPKSEWQVRSVRLSGNLTAYVVIPVGKE